MLHLDKDESVIFEVRKHWIVFFSQAFFHSIGALAPLFLYGAIKEIIPLNLSIGGNSNALITFVYFLWLGVLWLSFFVQWSNYFLDVWYVTQKRIIDVEQKRHFHREVSSIRFDKIQDITVEVEGLVATFLNYGDIRVQTASETSKDFVMKTAGNPERIRQTVFAQHNQQSERVQEVHVVDKNHDGIPDDLEHKIQK